MHSQAFQSQSIHKNQETEYLHKTIPTASSPELSCLSPEACKDYSTAEQIPMKNTLSNPFWDWYRWGGIPSVWKYGTTRWKVNLFLSPTKILKPPKFGSGQKQKRFILPTSPFKNYKPRKSGRGKRFTHLFLSKLSSK